MDFFDDEDDDLLLTADLGETGKVNVVNHADQTTKVFLLPSISANFDNQSNPNADLLNQNQLDEGKNKMYP